MRLKLKKRVYEIVERAQEGDRASKLFDTTILMLIVLNLISLTLESIKEFEDYSYLLNRFEFFSYLVFSIEYAVRLWSCTENERYRRHLTGRVRYAFTIFMVIDFIALVPFLLPILEIVDLRSVRVYRILRLFRIFRVFRLARHMEESFISLWKALKAEAQFLWVITSVSLIFLFVSATIVYQLEMDAQKEVFTSIPKTFWWAIITATTVGYGDMYPISPLGMVYGSLLAFFGPALIGANAGIFFLGFALREKKQEDDNSKPKQTVSACQKCGHVNKYCSNCGALIS